MSLMLSFSNNMALVNVCFGVWRRGWELGGLGGTYSWLMALSVKLWFWRISHLVGVLGA